jgi:hypothetical protein
MIKKFLEHTDSDSKLEFNLDDISMDLIIELIVKMMGKVFLLVTSYNG